MNPPSSEKPQPMVLATNAHSDCLSISGRVSSLPQPVALSSAQGKQNPSQRAFIRLAFRFLSDMELYTDSNEAFVLAKQFVHDMGCNTLDISFTNEKLEAAMQAEIDERNIQCPHLQRTLHVASSLIEVC